MKYRVLGSTGLKVSVIGVGTWQFGGEWGKNFSAKEVETILDRALDLGINLIDTAECYGNHLSEKLIGRAIRKNRDRWIVATKFGHHFKGFMNREDVFETKSVLKQLEGSLKALKSDSIDLYQFHSGLDSAFDDDTLWTALDKEVQKGKIRHLGVSLGKSFSLHQTENAPRRHVGAMQIYYNRLSRQAEEKVFPLCQELNLGVLARVPLENGYLTGKYKPGAVFEKGDVRHTHTRERIDAALKESEEIQRNEVPPGVNMAQWAIAWCLKHPAVTCVIPGAKNVEQVEKNAGAADLEWPALITPAFARLS